MVWWVAGFLKVDQDRVQAVVVEVRHKEAAGQDRDQQPPHDLVFENECYETLKNDISVLLYYT